jgi:mannose-6-phosphate isomerase-like protein (cupin superfamily)
LISGKGTLHFPEELLEGNENTSIFVPSGALRGWENSGKTELEL